MSPPGQRFIAVPICTGDKHCIHHRFADDSDEPAIRRAHPGVDAAVPPLRLMPRRAESTGQRVNGCGARWNAATSVATVPSDEQSTPSPINEGRSVRRHHGTIVATKFVPEDAVTVVHASA